jgi:YidC/Oxa1 family membrane protein insertase
VLAEIPVISPLFQALLDGIGAVLAWIYGVVGNYGVSIIILTIVIRVILLPLGVKQIKSMQAMQAIQPKVKEIQKKYRNDKPKAQEETMKLYRESGVNPLGGCLPLLLQFPILISMYSVIRAPTLEPVTEGNQVVAYEVRNNHLPTDSTLFERVIGHEGTNFAWMNLQCSASQAGTTVQLMDPKKAPILEGKPLTVPGSDQEVGLSRGALDCGQSVPAKIPYFVILAFMIGTTFYQQRQMTKASPAGAQSSQQQAILKIMPVMFGIFGYTFPAGLVVYWTTSNLWQIGQQAALLRAGHIGPDALERRKQEIANKPPKTGGMFSGMLSKAEEERKRRGLATPGGTTSRGASGAKKPSGSKGGSGAKGTSKGTSKGGSAARGGQGSKGGGAPRPRPAKGTPPQRPRPKKPGGGTTDGS